MQINLYMLLTYETGVQPEPLMTYCILYDAHILPQLNVTYKHVSKR